MKELDVVVPAWMGEALERLAVRLGLTVDEVCVLFFSREVVHA